MDVESCVGSVRAENSAQVGLVLQEKSRAHVKTRVGDLHPINHASVTRVVKTKEIVVLMSVLNVAFVTTAPPLAPEKNAERTGVTGPVASVPWAKVVRMGSA